METDSVTPEKAYESIKTRLECHGAPLIKDGPTWLKEWIQADTWEGEPRPKIFATGGPELGQLCRVLKETQFIALMVKEKGLDGLDASALRVIDAYLGLTASGTAKTRLCTGAVDGTRAVDESARDTDRKAPPRNRRSSLVK